jgi:hypothetical protein
LQGVQVDELIGHLPVPNLLVAAFAGLIVVSHDADALGHQREMLLERMETAGEEKRHTPDHNLDLTRLRQPKPIAQ